MHPSEEETWPKRPPKFLSFHLTKPSLSEIRGLPGQKLLSKLFKFLIPSHLSTQLFISLQMSNIPISFLKINMHEI